MTNEACRFILAATRGSDGIALFFHYQLLRCTPLPCPVPCPAIRHNNAPQTPRCGFQTALPAFLQAVALFIGRNIKEKQMKGSFVQTLAIAGSDSGGGAGIQADLKTFQMRGVFGTCVIAAVTAQNTLGVSAVHLVPTETITAQIQAIRKTLTSAPTKSVCSARRKSSNALPTS